MPKAKKEISPAIIDEEDDLSKEDYADKDKLVDSKEFFEDDEEENVEDGDADDPSASAAIDIGDDF